MNENNYGQSAELKEKTDVELDEMIEQEVSEEEQTAREKSGYKIRRRNDIPEKNKGNDTLIAAISVVILVFTVIMSLSVLVINNLHIERPPQSDSTGTGGDSGEGTGKPIVPPIGGNPLFGEVESDYRSKPMLPSHANAAESTTAYRPTGSARAINGIYSSHSILVDASAGSVLYGDGIDDRIQIASMSKVMTLIVACDYITDEDLMYQGIKVKYDPKMTGYATCYISTNKPKYYESTVYVIDLLYGLILESGADCAYALAEGLAGSEAAFVEKMNAKAAALGMTDTHFTNCVGKDDGGDNYSSMRDVATMFRYALENDLCRAILTTESWVAVGDYDYLYASTGYLPVKAIVYTGIRKRKSDMVCGKSTVLGGKSGNEDLAGYCLVSLARSSDGKEYICVTAGGENGQQYDDAVTVYSNYIK